MTDETTKLDDTPETRQKLMDELAFNLTFKGADIIKLIDLLGELPASKTIHLINGINTVVSKSLAAHIEKVNSEEVKEEVKEEAKAE